MVWPAMHVINKQQYMFEYCNHVLLLHVTFVSILSTHLSSHCFYYVSHLMALLRGFWQSCFLQIV